MNNRLLTSQYYCFKVKYIHVVLLLFFSLSLSGAAYYVKPGGNDRADGRSDAAAWATIARVNSARLLPGDTVFFKRGGVWRITESEGSLECKSGAAGVRIVYTSYGIGPKPLFYGSVEKNRQADWSKAGDKLWVNKDPLLRTQAGNIVFNNGESCGVRKLNREELSKQGDFIYDTDTRAVILFSSVNPASFYNDIEITLTIMPSLIHARERNHVTIDGFDLRYAARHGIFISRSHNITVRNCEISFMGGTLPRSTRLGNGIEMWGSVADIVIEKNLITDVYDSGITSQYMNDSVFVSGIYIRNNILRRNDFHFEWWYMDCTGSAGDIYFENNTCTDAGRGWSHAQKTRNIHGEDIYISFLHQVSTRNLYIRNNIFSGALNYSVWGATNPSSLLSSLIEWRNNIYDKEETVFYMGQTGVHYKFEGWKLFFDNDEGSVNATQGFVSSTDLTPSAGSPAIDKGFPNGLKDDFFGNIRQGLPDIGAVERLIE
ncbi:MAG: right-handed parallel beta-helix repeat-containing protein [Bacteroidales bacterium]|jgi:hypothetical protein|nr:right-handed parallel beta-helix repeat-containing protein [Bacteroidales bacterium]